MTAVVGQRRPSAAGIDLADPNLFASGEHYAALARLRADTPMHWNPVADGGFWAVTRYDDVTAAHRNPALSSAYGAILGGSFNSDRDTASGRMVVCSDPPQHSQLRSMLMPLFSAQWVRRIGAQVQLLVAEAIADLAERGGGDLTSELTSALPVGALMTFFAVDRAAARTLLQLTHDMIGYRDPEHHGGYDDDQLRLAEAQAAIFDFFDDLIDDRRGRPSDDAVSHLLTVRRCGRPLSHDVVLFNLMNLAVGGNETTPHTAAHGLLELIEHPDQLARLRSDPTLVASTVEEMLRWASTNAYVQRVAVAPTEVAGVPVAVGDALTLWNCSANRDERIFADPDRFDVGRHPNRSVAFGSGIHHCIGSMTARAELAALVSLFADSQVVLRRDGDIRRLRSNFMLGITRLPVAVVAAPLIRRSCSS